MTVIRVGLPTPVIDIGTMTESAISRTRAMANRYVNESESAPVKPLPQLAKGDVGYMDHHVVGTIPRCNSCMHFCDVGKNVTDGSCDLVAGSIHSDGFCHFYHRAMHHDSSIVDDRTGDTGGRY